MTKRNFPVRQCRFCGFIVDEIMCQDAVADYYCERCERNPISHHRKHRSISTCKPAMSDEELAKWAPFKDGKPIPRQ